MGIAYQKSGNQIVTAYFETSEVESLPISQEEPGTQTAVTDYVQPAPRPTIEEQLPEETPPEQKEAEEMKPEETKSEKQQDEKKEDEKAKEEKPEEQEEAK